MGHGLVQAGHGTFDISADGAHILLRSAPDGEAPKTKVTLLLAVENWFAEIKRLAPPAAQ